MVDVSGGLTMSRINALTLYISQFAKGNSLLTWPAICMYLLLTISEIPV